ncbi:MAG: hypothetical protein B6D38_11580, partial [Anaerolineae bacterium UTCFX1]
HDPFCRKSFQWDEHTWDKDLLGYFKEIIALRKKNPAFRRGDMQRLWSANGVYAYSRAFEGKTFIVALNASEKAEQIHVTHESQKLPKAVFGNPSEIKKVDGRLNLTIPARSGVVLR